MYEVWVVATRPYVEKISSGEFYLTKEEAKIKAKSINEMLTLRGTDPCPFKVYRALIEIKEQADA